MSATAAGALGAAAWYFVRAHSDDEDARLASIVALGIVFSVLCTMSQVRALVAGRHAALARTIVVTGIIAAAASIGMAIWRQDVLALLIPMLLGYLLPVLILGTPSISGLTSASRLTAREGRTLIEIGLAGVVTAPMYWLLTSADRWFLQHYRGTEAVGVYSVGYSIAIVGLMVNNAVNAVWQPEATREYEEDRGRAPFTLGKLMSRLMAAMALVWLAASAAGGDIVRWLANERFHAAADYVPYLAGGVFFHGVVRLANAGLLISRQLKWSAVWWFAGGLLCGLLNVLSVPRYGGVGAAATQCASFAFIAVAILATSQIKFRIHLDWTRLGATVLLVLVAGYFMAPPWHETPLLSISMKLPVGAAVAIIVALIIAPDWCIKGFDYLRHRAISASSER
jgi:O-antigen/teichoic acid export membrane protein